MGTRPSNDHVGAGVIFISPRCLLNVSTPVIHEVIAAAVHRDDMTRVERLGLEMKTMPLKAGERAMLQIERQPRRAEKREDDEKEGLGSRIWPRSEPIRPRNTPISR
jgi:hypothetical protein